LITLLKRGWGVAAVVMQTYLKMNTSTD